MIYVASPYNHRDECVKQARMELVYEVIAEYVMECKIAFSPLLMHAVVKRYTDLPTEFEYWKEFCFSFLRHSTMMVVIMQEGWDNSPGLTAEIEFCKEYNIPLIYYEV